MVNDPCAPTCPFCESPAYRVVGSTGIANKVSVVRCCECGNEWEEVLMFRYRRPRRPDDPAPSPFTASDR